MPLSSTSRRFADRCSALAIAAALVLAGAGPVFALSELRSIPGTAQPAERDAEPSPGSVPRPDAPPIPMPDPLVNTPSATGDAADTADERATPAEVLTDISKIPEPVRRMRELIVEAAASGDVERLRSILGKGETATQIGDGSEEDPVAAIKALSGDPDGLEILAIMLDLLSTGFVRLEPGTPDEMYVWPYFVGRPLDQLTPPEKVDLLRLVTAGDVAAMQEFGSYNFYRIGISPDGRWTFFTGGD